MLKNNQNKKLPADHVLNLCRMMGEGMKKRFWWEYSQSDFNYSIIIKYANIMADRAIKNDDQSMIEYLEMFGYIYPGFCEISQRQGGQH